MKHFVIIVIFLFFTTASAQGISSPDDYLWEPAGPGGGGCYMHPAISPHDPDLMFCGNDMSSFYRSEDGGKNWRTQPFARSAGCLVRVFFHPADKDLMLAFAYTGDWQQAVLIRSEDRGRSWQRQTLVQSIVFDGMGGGFGIREENLVYTADKGKTWAPLSGKPPFTLDEIAGMFAGVPSEGLIVGTSRGIFRSLDGGKSWQQTGKDFVSLKKGQAITLAASQGKQNSVLYLLAGEKGPIYRSRDGGRTWAPTAGKNLPPDRRWHHLTVSEGYPEVMFIAVAGGPEGADPKKDGSYATVWRSGDGGDSWSACLFQHPDMPRYNIINTNWLTGEWGWAEDAFDIAVGAGDPGRVMVTTVCQVFVSENSGKTWRSVVCGPRRGQGDSAGGMPIMTAWNYVFDPTDYQRRYIPMTDFDGWRSADGGRTWQRNVKGIPYAHNCYALVCDPKVPGRAWATESMVHDIPLWNYMTDVESERHKGWVLLTTNYAESWQVVGQETGGLPNKSITDLYLDLDSPVQARWLWAAVLGRGVYCSKDGGKNWKNRSEGIEGNLNVLRVRRDPHGRLFALTTIKFEGQKFISGALYIRSRDNTRWERVLRGEPDSYRRPDFNGKGPSFLTDFEVDPKNPMVMFVTGFPLVRGGQGGGVWKTSDGGKTWDKCLDLPCFSVTANPADSNHIFAATFQDGLYTSFDAGKKWRRIDSYPFFAPIRVVFDPRDSKVLYVTNLGSSVWRGRLTREKGTIQ